jgi:LysR family cyn operon transcriptional activator
VTPSVAAYLIGPLLQRFRTRYPGIFLAIRVSAQEAIEPALRDDELDLGIGFGDLPAEDIEVTPLHDERPSVIVAAERVRRRKASVTATELAQMPMALLDPTFSTRRLVDRYFRSQNLRPNVAVEANSFEALNAIVRHTDLATILPANVAAGGLAIVRLQPEFEARRAALLRRRSAYCSAAVRAFIITAQELAEAFTNT